MAAGVINGLGHHTGYRNFECPDAARNIVPWGLLVGGEELHNNHHAFPAAAKFSIRPGEIDIGWFYIRVLQTIGLAEVRRLAPTLARTEARTEVDLNTLKAVLINRMHVLRNYAKHVTGPTCHRELRLATGKHMRAARKLLVRDAVLLDSDGRQRLRSLLATSAALRTVYEFRERLTALWTRTHASNEQLLDHLRAWIVDAEAAGLPMLRLFALTMREVALSPRQSAA